MEYYRHISLAREKALGPDHFSTLHLKHILIIHLMNENQYDEACKIASTMTRLDNLSPSDRIAVNTILARLWAALGETEKAESVHRGLLECFADGRGPEDSERLDHQLDLVNLLLGRGEHEQALALALKTVEECLQELGLNHSITRSAKRRLAAAYDANGQLEKAVEVNEDLTRLKERVSADEQLDPVLVQDVARLGVQYYLLGRSDAALGCYKKVDNFVKRSIEMAAPAVDAVNNCAVRLINCGELEKAATILERLLPESSTVLGVQSKETAMVMGNLAYVYESKMQWDKVETLERQVLKTRRLVLGDSHPDTIIAMGNLRQTLLVQKRYLEAVDIARQELASICSQSNEQKIDAVETIAMAFESAGGSAEAVAFLEAEIALNSAETENPLPSGIVSAMVLATICHLHVDQVSRARELMAKFLPQLQNAKHLKEDCDILITNTMRLANMCLERDFIVEGEQVMAGLTVMYPQLPEDEALEAQFQRVMLELSRKTSAVAGHQS
jgi:tetratricopeptide (TPR) repeat protein